MDVGLLFPFRNPPQWRTPWPQFYAEQLKQTQIAEELGYDTVWLTEHHFAEDGYSPSLLPIASAVATLTSRVRIGTFLLLLPLHNAVRVGEDAATVDIISNGRFDMGFGQGYSPSEFEGYGIPRKQRASLLEEGIEVIRGMWTQDPFSYTMRCAWEKMPQPLISFPMVVLIWVSGRAIRRPSSRAMAFPANNAPPC